MNVPRLHLKRVVAAALATAGFILIQLAFRAADGGFRADWHVFAGSVAATLVWIVCSDQSMPAWLASMLLSVLVTFANFAVSYWLYRADTFRDAGGLGVALLSLVVIFPSQWMVCLVFLKALKRWGGRKLRLSPQGIEPRARGDSDK